MTVRAGQLRHRVRIEQRSSTLDAAGEQARGWDLKREVYAAVEPLLGKEFFASQQRQGRVQTRFRMRWIPGLVVLPSMRLVWDGRVFNITDVQNVRGLKAELVVMADELVGEAP